MLHGDTSREGKLDFLHCGVISHFRDFGAEGRTRRFGQGLAALTIIKEWDEVSGHFPPLNLRKIIAEAASSD